MLIKTYKSLPKFLMRLSNNFLPAKEKTEMLSVFSKHKNKVNGGNDGNDNYNVICPFGD